jgi:uncharacterized alkaline shock family protein YloU
MSTTASREAAPGTDPTAGIPPADRVPPEERGRLTIDDRVVQKVAGHAVTFVADAAAAPRRMLGVNLGGARAEAPGSVGVHMHGGVASVEVAIAVRWPRSVQQVAHELRERIRSDVATMTGVRVDHVDVDVVSMTLADSSERRVV